MQTEFNDERFRRLTGNTGPDRVDHPGSSLETIFRRIHREQMLDLPILNPALEVEAVGFAPYCGHSLGILITPWFMKLMLLPGEAPWPELREGKSQYWRFPGGALKFVAEYDEQVGAYQACSLFSPMREFAGQEEACAAAQAILLGLFNEAASVSVAVSAPPSSSGPLAEMREAVAAPMSKRDFLRGSFLRRQREPRR